MPVIEKRPCEDECARANEIGYSICKRCFKAISVEVESPEEKRAREFKEEQDFINMAENARPTILERMDSLNDHDKMMVFLYIGDEAKKRCIDPLTPIGHAMTILLSAEAMMIMVPKENRPWENLEMDCDMGTCPDNFDRENKHCKGCSHNKARVIGNG